MKIAMYSDRRIKGDDGSLIYINPKFFDGGVGSVDYFCIHGTPKNIEVIREWYKKRGIPETIDPLSLMKPLTTTVSTGENPLERNQPDITSSAKARRDSVDYVPPEGKAVDDITVGIKRKEGSFGDNCETDHIADNVKEDQEQIIQDIVKVNDGAGNGDWRDLSWPKMRSLAKKYTDEPVHNKVAAEKVLTEHLG